MPPPSSEFDFAQVIRAGDSVIWPQGTGEPTGLSGKLIAGAAGLPPFTLVVGMVTTQTLADADGKNPSFLCLNGAGGARKAVALSGGRVVPAHVSSLPGLILSRRIPVDVVLIRVRPTANPHVLSLGVMADFVHEMVEAARVVVAEIDERMPLTRADALIEASRITHFTTADGVEPLLPDPEPSPTDIAVARRVAALIPDRATVQFGVGGLPVAVCAALKDHKDLGLHSGVIPECALDLIEAGVVTNAHKGLDPGVTVTGGLFGATRLNAFAHENDAIALRRATYTHSPRTMAGLERLYTINSSIEIDLSGQVNSEMAGGRYVGAVGGQIDYVRGGRLSPGGRSIIAMASTTPDGRHSKIVVSLGDRPVTTARSDVDLVVTEYGVADLWGLDLRARVEALIAIAHPDFREDLERGAAGDVAKTDRNTGVVG
ncbi:acetyl-CoA hydrolase/transferase family protein [Plastorhodobacter daqingensis]|uniref:Acetyl-CoA hydrolase/transferase family protein n=1 Tax=Plastorhodobacter daqingensis TaxID=1387281 RepID=A0ABW2USD7_9RHOB